MRLEGITVGYQEYSSPEYGTIKEVVVKRIMIGSIIDQQGLVHENDVIREVNGTPIASAEALQALLKKTTSGQVTMKIIPVFRQKQMPSQVRTI
ncbi:unnamed protein product [Protopolystoma xenopodis]|uniref:PDZ domain-containing protein n=1 Tax=Protopolystoma xenopodis TaxID=117903 RepID=A0A448WLD1_9PLAT|nr:unnamed protein product [Protopolystoma xenopodis]